MKITNEFTVHTPIDQAWKLLTDLEAIAPCMPGAALTGVEGDTYKGKVKIKVGPVISEFAGTARFISKNDTDHTAAIDAKGRDARSAGQAAAVVTAVLRPAGDDSTTVSVDTDLKITGKLAQFGSGMIKEVSTKLLAQFVTNLEAKLAADSAPPAADSSAPADPAVSSSAPADPAVSSAPLAEPAVSSAPAAAVSSAPASVAASAAAVETVPDSAFSPAPVSPAPVNGATSALARSAPTAAVNGVDSAPARQAAASSSRAPLPASSPGSVASSSPRAVSPQAVPAPSAQEPEPLDLLSIAGGSIYKRLIPVAVGVVVVGAVVAWLVARR
jgi:carbon monoxide dehydrogenase subunit G